MPEEAAKKNVAEKAGLFAGRAMEAVSLALPNFANLGSGKVADAATWCAGHGGITLRTTTSGDTALASCPIATEEQMSLPVSGNHPATPPGGAPANIDPAGTVGVIVSMPEGRRSR